MSGSLRIKSGSRTAVADAMHASASLPDTSSTKPVGSALSKEPDEYLARLVKLIPAEVLALYLGVKGSFNGNAEHLAVWGLICLGLVIIVRCAATYESGKRIQFGAVFVAAVSFIVWIYAAGGEIEFFPPALDWLKKFSSAAVAVWTFVVPYLYRGD